MSFYGIGRKIKCVLKVMEIITTERKANFEESSEQNRLEPYLKV